MATNQINLYKKRIRQANNSRKRQALFISEYVQTKYNEIYMEAAELYNSINVLYPKKPDLTKSSEFKNWKLAQSGNPKIKPHIPRHPDLKWSYEDIVIEDKEIIEDIGIQDKEILDEIVASVPKKTLQLTIPLMSAQHIDRLSHGQDSDEATDKNRQDSDEATDKNRQDSDEATDKNRQDSDEATDKNRQDLGEQQQASDEVDEIQPSIFDNVSNKIMTEIMEQLRGDPDLSRIMDDIDMEYQFDDLDIGMEIELEDPLEEEMQSIM